MKKQQQQQAAKVVQMNELAKDTDANMAQASHKRLSLNEYKEMYNLDDPEVFKQQADQLNSLTECNMLMSIAIRLAGVKTVPEYNERIALWHQEGTYFRELLQNKIRASESV